MGQMRRRNPAAWGRFPRRRTVDPEATPDEIANDADHFEEQLADWAEAEPAEDDDDEGNGDEAN